MERHDLDPVSLIFGILFLGLASTALFDNIDLTFFEARWVWPMLLIVAGVLVLVSSINRTRAESATMETGSSSLLDDDAAM
jgi:hypothetical protein